LRSIAGVFASIARLAAVDRFSGGGRVDLRLAERFAACEDEEEEAGDEEPEAG
jgi:hypothetical protein